MLKRDKKFYSLLVSKGCKNIVRNKYTNQKALLSESFKLISVTNKHIL